MYLNNFNFRSTNRAQLKLLRRCQGKNRTSFVFILSCKFSSKDISALDFENKTKINYFKSYELSQGHCSKIMEIKRKVW